MINFTLSKHSISIRPLTLKNFSNDYIKWINSKNINKFLETKKITKKNLEKYIVLNLNSPKYLLCGVFLNKIHIGNIRMIRDIKYKDHCSIGILIGKKTKIIGLTPIIISKFSDFLFKNKQINTIKAGIRVENIKSLIVFLKSGFQIDGFKNKNKKNNKIVTFTKHKNFK